MEITSLSLVLPELEGVVDALTRDNSLSLECAERACARLANERARVWLELREFTGSVEFGRAIECLKNETPSLPESERVLRAARLTLENADFLDWQRLEDHFGTLTNSLLLARERVEELESNCVRVLHESAWSSRAARPC